MIEVYRVKSETKSANFGLFLLVLVGITEAFNVLEVSLGENGVAPTTQSRSFYKNEKKLKKLFILSIECLCYLGEE